MCVCVCEREKERVCVCVCERCVWLAHSPGEGLVNEVVVVEEEEAGELGVFVAASLALHVQSKSIHYSCQVMPQVLPPISIRYHSK